jgi:hypothetical protein
MPNQPSPPAAQPPPDLPNLPGVPAALTNYLTRFSLWCRNGFAAKVDKQTATAGILLQAKDTMPADPAGSPPRVYMLQVSVASGAPVLVWTPSPPGTGLP